MDINISIEIMRPLFGRLMPHHGFCLIIIYKVIVALQQLCNDHKEENIQCGTLVFGLVYTLCNQYKNW